MTSALKIRCFLKTTAKKFCSRLRGREAEKKQCFEKGGEREVGGGVAGVCDKRSEFLGRR